MPARLRLSWDMKTWKLFFLSVLESPQIRLAGHPLCSYLCLGADSDEGDQDSDLIVISVPGLK